MAHRNALGPVRGQHAPRRQVPVRARDRKALVAGRVLGEFGRRGRFEAQVEFAQHHRFEMRDDKARLQPAAGGREPFDHRGAEVEGVDVAPEGGGDIGAQHLDRDLGAGVGAPRAVDLGDGGCGDRGRELGEQDGCRGAKLGLDGGLGDLGGEGRQPVLQHPQLLGQFGADDVGAGREDLAELDIGRSQRGDRPRDRRQRRIAAKAQPAERPAQHPGGGAHPRRGAHGVERDAHRARALEGGAGADQAQDVVRAAHRVRVSSPNAARRCPSRGSDTGHARSPPRGSWRRKPPDRGSGGSIRRDTDSCRGRLPRPRRGAGSH